MKGITLLLCTVVAVVVVMSRPAAADDKKIACVNIGDDAGTTGFVTLPVNQGQVMIRCEGYATRHKFGIGSGTVATSTDSIIDADKSFDLCPQGDNTRVSFYKGYDGGNPQCCVYQVKPVTGACK